jgi:hypothetical protein
MIKNKSYLPTYSVNNSNIPLAGQMKAFLLYLHFALAISLSAALNLSIAFNHRH